MSRGNPEPGVILAFRFSAGVSLDSEGTARPETPGITWARSWQTCFNLTGLKEGTSSMRPRGSRFFAESKAKNHGKIMGSPGYLW